MNPSDAGRLKPDDVQEHGQVVSKGEVKLLYGKTTLRRGLVDRQSAKAKPLTRRAEARRTHKDLQNQRRDPVGEDTVDRSRRSRRV